MVVRLKYILIYKDYVMDNHYYRETEQFFSFMLVNPESETTKVMNEFLEDMEQDNDSEVTAVFNRINRNLTDDTHEGTLRWVCDEDFDKFNEFKEKSEYNVTSKLWEIK